MSDVAVSRTLGNAGLGLFDSVIWTASSILLGSQPDSSHLNSIIHFILILFDCIFACDLNPAIGFFHLSTFSMFTFIP